MTEILWSDKSREVKLGDNSFCTRGWSHWGQWSPGGGERCHRPGKRGQRGLKRDLWRVRIDSNSAKEGLKEVRERHKHVYYQNKDK